MFLVLLWLGFGFGFPVCLFLEDPDVHMSAGTKRGENAIYDLF